MAVPLRVMHPQLESENLEIELLLEAVYQRYGYDFRNYARGSITRRLRQHLPKANVTTISDLIPKIMHQESAFHNLAFELSIPVTEMFRDPSFYRGVREHVIPFLKTFPFINVWHAGCATGEEVYSMAILLQEEGLYERAQIYATDFNDEALQKAQERIYPLEKIQEYSANYQAAGGKKALSDYYQTQYEAVLLDASLQKRITFANHNLVTDSVFAEMHLILCRNVLIYFDRTLQARVLSLFRDSLCHQGFLCLGNKETLRFSEIADDFVEIVQRERIYQHKGSG